MAISISTRLDEDEYLELRKLALSERKSLSEWATDTFREILRDKASTEKVTA